jgi:tRNA (cmo5U34)-methyltransferase
VSQFHFDPATYPHLMRAEVPAYGRRQEAVAAASDGVAVHHLEGPDKAVLFARVAGVLRPGGRFVLGDVVVPVDPADAVTPLTPDHDRPATLAEQLAWLADAGLDAAPTWSERDLVVVRADRRG